MNQDEIYQEYKKQLPIYGRAEKNIKGAITEFLNENDIPFLAITSRVKEFDSFYEKISRKHYDNPFSENEDFCGIRIILYYLDDIEKVQQIIENNFIVQKTENKSDKLGSNEFGYRSNHLIIKIKDSWSVTPNYKGLENIKIELQIRTSLMHTWAAIEHKLGYKANQELNESLKRKLFLLSAKLEDADMQFQEIKHQADNYQKATLEESLKVGKFIGTKLNIDTIQALLKFYFPTYEENEGMEKDLLDKIIKQKISMYQVLDCANKIQPLVGIINNNLNTTTTRSNIMKYGLEVFMPDYKSGANASRKKIITELKSKANNKT